LNFALIDTCRWWSWIRCLPICNWKNVSIDRQITSWSSCFSRRNSSPTEYDYIRL